MNGETEKLLTPKEIAELLRVTPSAVYKWVAQGDIPYIKIQQRKRKALIRFRPSALQKWLHKKEIANCRPLD